VRLWRSVLIRIFAHSAPQSQEFVSGLPGRLLPYSTLAGVTAGLSGIHTGYAMRRHESALATVGLLGAQLLSRFDSVVRVATATNWLPARDAAERSRAINLGAMEWCSSHQCPRLPGIGLPLYIVTSLLVALIPPLLILLISRRLIVAPVGGAPERLAWNRKWRQFFAWAAIVVLALGIAATCLRIAYGNGVPIIAGYLTGVAGGQWLVAALTGVLLLRVSLALGGEGAGASWARVRTFLGRHSLQVALAVGYFVFVMAVPITREQTLDALRLIDFSSTAGISSFGFLVSSTLLLVLVLYESGLRIEAEEASRPASGKTAISPRKWRVVGLAVFTVGAVGLLSHALGTGLAILGLLLLLLAALESMKPVDPTAATTLLVKDTEPMEGIVAYVEAAPSQFVGFIAVIPVLTLSGAILIAIFDVLIMENARLAQVSGLLPGLVLLGWVSYVLMARRSARVHLLTSGHTTIPRQVWLLVPVMLLALALVLTQLPPGTRLTAVASVSLALLALGYLIRVFFGIGVVNSVALPSSPGWSVPTAFGAGIAILFVMHADPINASRVVGSVGLINLAAAAFAGLFFLLALASNRHRPPAALLWLGLQRLPVVTLLLAWSILAAITAPRDLNTVRLLARTEAGPGPLLEDAFQAWLSAQPEFTRVGSGFGTRKDVASHAVPLVLVASHGGGIRAAYWTALVMDCVVGVSVASTGQNADWLLDHPGSTCSDRRRTPAAARTAAGRVFLASGVSGGAVGLVAYAQEMLKDGVGNGEWVDRRLGKDFLSPSVGWGLFHDLPNTFLGLSPDALGGCRLVLRSQCVTWDRAAILEDAFDGDMDASKHLLRGTWDDRASSDSETAAKARAVPLIVGNASTPAAGLRILVSAADLGIWPEGYNWNPLNGLSIPRPVAAAADVADMLCSTYDMRLSTAAFLSARFPLVSPAGRIRGNCQVTPGESFPHFRDSMSDYHSACATGDTYCEVQIVDGGYVDNSGLFTIALLWPELRRLIARQNALTPATPIAVVVVDIDSHYQDEVAFRQPSAAGLQTLVPVKTFLGAGAALENAALGAVLQAHPVNCFLTIAPQLRPGLSAPLGWALSVANRAELRAGLVRPAPGAIGASARSVYRLRTLQSWLEPELSGSFGFDSALKRCLPTL
jgi:hypothetical protein